MDIGEKRILETGFYRQTDKGAGMDEYMQEPQVNQMPEHPNDTQKKKKGRWKNVLLIFVEVSVLLAAVAVLYVVTRDTGEV